MGNGSDKWSGFIGGTGLADEGLVLLQGVHDVTVDAVGACWFCFVTVDVLRKDVPKVGSRFRHDSSVGTPDHVFFAHEETPVFMKINWLHGCFPTGIARRCAWPVGNFADPV